MPLEIWIAIGAGLFVVLLSLMSSSAAKADKKGDDESKDQG